MENPIDEAVLLDMLTYKRVGRSRTERKFIAKYLDSVPGMRKDKHGNRYIKVGTSDVMWSCHTDTVHRSAGRLKVKLDEDGIAHVDDQSNCLGGDDAVGVWICLRMIHAGVPGTYVFHRDEESGGRGSDYIAIHNPGGILDGLRFCIALDRKGYNDIITHQYTGRTASDAFAESLAGALDLDMRPDDTGSFTDSANYAERIAECTNISVGYARQHTALETVDVAFAMRLADVLCNEFDESKLVEERAPGALDDYEWYDIDDPRYATEEDDLRRVIEKYPDAVVAMCQDYGIDVDDVLDYVTSNSERKAF